MRTNRPLPIVLGALLAILALGLLTAGGVLAWAHTTQRDADGFYTSPDYRVTTDGYAIASEDLELFLDDAPSWLTPDDVTVRLAVTSPTSSPLFLGVGPADRVAGYLDGVPHDVVTAVGAGADDVTYRSDLGTREPAPPAAQDFWLATAEGAGSPALTLDLRSGNWTAVLMTADATAGFDATFAAAVDVPFVLPIAIGLLIGGLVLAAAAAALLVVGIAPTSDARAATAGAPSGPTVYPVALEARLDAPSRWQWLVKWLLALPHFVVLAVLWAAFALLTVVAGFAILFTGRYPRGIFDFNVGVLRWTWRVTYYAFVLGTDRYPPFTLSERDVDGYPATFTVAYPGELSRGLVLVKWWLLAIPHYLVVGVLTGSLLAWTFDVAGSDTGLVVQNGGLIGLMVVIAAVILLVRGRYPQGLFDLVTGMERWVYRVVAYAALMTDDYPPFRLDSGGSEPPPSGPVPPTAPTDDASGHREPAPV